MLGAIGLSVAFVPLLLIRDTPAVRAQVRAARHLGRRFSNPALLLKLVIPRLFFSFGAGLFFPFLTLFFKQRFANDDAVFLIRL